MTSEVISDVLATLLLIKSRMKQIQNKLQKQHCLIIIALTIVIGLRPLKAETEENKTETSDSNVRFWPTLDLGMGASYGVLENDKGEKDGTKLLALLRGGLAVSFTEDDDDEQLITYLKILGEANFGHNGLNSKGVGVRSGVAAGAVYSEWLPLLAVEMGVTWSLTDLIARPTTYLSIGLPVLVFVQFEIQHDWEDHRLGTLLKIWIPMGRIAK